MRQTIFILLMMVTTLCSGQKVNNGLNAQEPQVPLVPKMNWGDIEYRGNAWVQNTNRPYQPEKGLQGRHLSIIASHGRYYDQNEHAWAWQRPPLYCTTEDLLTQTFVVPLLYPMLEHAGAIVWTPRERCWMREEVIVDNDTPSRGGLYLEQNGSREWQSAGQGFAWLRETYKDDQNPHNEGTSRMAEAQSGKRGPSSITWTPNLPKDGEYAVYVTYPSMPTNVPDAKYVVRHKGVSTTIRVNQQMGAGTWVYLGTFDFAAGFSKDNCVTLNNISNYRGVVSADAVRFGGGMGNELRTDSLGVGPKLSNLPRYLEGARYSSQWYGMPYDVYSFKQGTGDYSDEILSRPLSTNHLARGSVYLPGDSGLCVPIEMEMAIHSDAGWRKDMSHIGSLAILTSDFEDGILPSGVSRKAARSLCEIFLKTAETDLNRLYGYWEARGIWDRNYGETRVPRTPSVIFEMFSHQNFAEMILAHDPNFKFDMARVIYKSILRYTARMHGREADVVVQPLPVEAFAAETDRINHRIKLSWIPAKDVLESTATPTSYILYTAKGDNGWDNGTVVTSTTHYVDAEEDVLYRFRVEALNEGGASMPSEELCAILSSNLNAPELLLVNGFTRLAAPHPFDNDSLRGFDMSMDPGVAYIHTPEYCGRQQYFNKDGFPYEKSNGLGYSSQEWIGMLMKGNTFDYPTLHARDIIGSGFSCHISSCSRKALEEKQVEANSYRLLDVIMGAQRYDGYSRRDFTVFTPALREVLQGFTSKGGSLLLSGAYVGIDKKGDQATSHFTQRVLHWQEDGEVRADSLLSIQGMNTQATLTMVPNERHLSTPRTSALQPAGSEAFPILVYPASNRTAAVAYKGPDCSTITLGFPIEQIEEEQVRRQLMGAFMQYLLNK